MRKPLKLVKFLWRYPDHKVPPKYLQDWNQNKNKNLFIKATIYFLTFILVLLFHYFAIDIPIKSPDLAFWKLYRFGVSGLFMILLALAYKFKDRNSFVLNILILLGGLFLTGFQGMSMIERKEVPYFYISILPTLTIMATSISIVPSLVYSTLCLAICLPAIIVRAPEAYKIYSFHSVMQIMIIAIKFRVLDQINAFLLFKRNREITEQIHHDLQSPISVLDVCLGDTQSNIIKSALRRIKEISDDLSKQKESYSQLKQGDIITDITDVIEEKRRENQGASIVFKHDERLQVAFSNYSSSHFKRLISNLINNAIESHETIPPKIQIQLKESDSYFVLEIKDHGIGIPKEIREKILQRGFTTKKKKGKGLGLYHAAQCLEAWQGKLKFDSSPEGTTVYLSLKAIVPHDS